MNDSKLKTYSLKTLEDIRQGSSASLLVLCLFVLAPAAVPLLFCVHSDSSIPLHHWSCAGQIVLSLISLRLVGAFFHYLPERNFLYALSGVLTGLAIIFLHANSLLSHHLGNSVDPSLYRYLFYVSLLILAAVFIGGMAGLLVNQLTWPWLQHRVDTLVDSFATLSAPPRNGGLPLDLRNLFYDADERKRFAAHNGFSFAAAFLLMALTLIGTQAIPGVAVLLEETSLAEALLQAFGLWLLIAIGLSWVTRCLEPPHAHLLVSVFAFGGPWLFYRIAFGEPYGAMLLGATGLLLARSLTKFFRAGNRCA